MRTVVHAACAVVLTTLVACQEPQVGADYRENHPLVVGEETVSLLVPLPFARESMSAGEKARIRGFVADYLARGKGNVTVEMIGTEGATGDATSGEWLRWARDTLIRGGLRTAEVSVLAGTRADSQNAVLMTYAAATVQVPGCKDWSSGSTLMPHNRPHSNFGCSIQRNVGLMIENPADLEKARAMTGRDPRHTIRVIVNHQAGTPTGSQKSAAQQTGIGE